MWEKFKDWVSASPSTQIGKWVRSRIPIDEEKLTDHIEHFSAEPKWTPEDKEKLHGWILEQRITCPQCKTRLEEWDPEKGGDVHAYYPKVFLDPGCKVIHDAYDAERENRKQADGSPGNMNGVRVRLVPKEAIQREQRERRIKQKKEAGVSVQRSHIPFYPFP